MSSKETSEAQEYARFSTDSESQLTNIYYHMAFKRILEGTIITWNWAAGLFSIVWMLYRRLYLFFVLALGYVLIIDIFIEPYFEKLIAEILPRFNTTEVEFAGSLIAALIEILTFGLLGNFLYFLQIKSYLNKGYRSRSGSSTDALAVWVVFILIIVYAILDFLREYYQDLAPFATQENTIIFVSLTFGLFLVIREIVQRRELQSNLQKPLKS